MQRPDKRARLDDGADGPLGAAPVASTSPPAPPPPPAVLADVLELNVGGRLFTVSRTTLSAQPGSMLEALVSGRHARPCLTDTAGRPFLERDGELFAEARSAAAAAGQQGVREDAGRECALLLLLRLTAALCLPPSRARRC
jgi:hypothetical protein